MLERKRPAALAGLVLFLGMGPAYAGLCPNGEITLQTAGALRVLRRAPGADELRGGRASFVVPVGDAIAPGHEPTTLVLEADHAAALTLALPAGAFVASRNGETFVHREGRSTLSLRRARAAYRLTVRLRGVDLAALDPAHPPAHLKELVKIGDDCFSAVLACTGRRNGIACRPERSALLSGRVEDPAHGRLAGVMVTAYDVPRLESVSVFTQEDGRYTFPPLRPGRYRVRARQIGWEDAFRDDVALKADRVAKLDFALAPAADVNAQLSASAWFSLLLAKWPDPKIRGDFTLSCGNCHQIAAYRFRRTKTEEEWRETLQEMMTFLPPYFQDTRDRLVDNVLTTYGPGTTAPPLPRPPPPAGEVLRAVVYEYGLGDDTSRPGCHDLELGEDGVVYQDGGVRWIDPRTGERGIYPITGGAHSIERAPDGNMWITQAGSDSIAKLDVGTGQFTYYPLPKIGDDQGAYPHTLRFNAQGQFWFTLTKSNHLALFDPPTAQFTYHRLPESDAAEVGLPIPVAYGCDVAPDQSVWYSQLFGERIGHLDPTTGAIRDWRPPFFGPRRLHADVHGIVWVPGYASGVLGRFDPAIERWKVYPLPTGLPGPPGFGWSETPYALNANRKNDEVWITGSASDTLIRFEPETERFTPFPLPTRASFTREIEFDPDNNVWTCTSNEPEGPDDPGRGKFVKVELPAPDAVCGNGHREAGEECDDGDADDCNGCSNRCTVVTGCGDGVVCGDEACDDGNDVDCDGCSAACTLEPGLRCGDGILNAPCGEECDPPAPGTCSTTCTGSIGCGNGVVDPGEACDDGNTDDCDGCTSACTRTTGCGDGVVCGTEACDDGNTADCDGCSATCEVEVGFRCGDGVVDAVCGEECDPPSDADPVCSYQCRLGAAPPLGTRHFSFGGASYTSALGTSTRLGTPDGAFDLVADAPGADGIATVSVAGPLYYVSPILGGSFGYICVRLSSCTGIVDCNGGTPVGVQVEQDSAGPGKQGNPPTTQTGLGPDGGPGAVLLTCAQALVQVPPPEPDCRTIAYPADGTTVYTTGGTEAHYLNGDPRIGTGEISVSGENFSCPAWSTEDGPGKLAGAYLMEADPQAGDTANVNLLDD